MSLEFSFNGRPDAEQADQRARLLECVRSYGPCAVAFSGGVDSAVVAKAAALVWGQQAIAVTGVSASLARGEEEAARQLAQEIGIRHESLPTGEFGSDSYLRNGADRCFHCKTELYSKMRPELARWNVHVIVNGANRDDWGDYRPGLKAASDQDVRSPLADAGFDKAAVRQLARYWQLSVWDKPAMPCLSSRVAYGEEVTPERLAMIDRAEQYLRSQGLAEVRVRYHRGDLARIEVPLTALARLCQPDFRSELLEHFEQLGFRFVTLDLAGFRSGSLNTLVTLDVARTP